MAVTVCILQRAELSRLVLAALFSVLGLLASLALLLGPVCGSERSGFFSACTFACGAFELLWSFVAGVGRYRCRVTSCRESTLRQTLRRIIVHLHDCNAARSWFRQDVFRLDRCDSRCVLVRRTVHWMFPYLLSRLSSRIHRTRRSVRFAHLEFGQTDAPRS